MANYFGIVVGVTRPTNFDEFVRFAADIVHERFNDVFVITPLKGDCGISLHHEELSFEIYYEKETWRIMTTQLRSNVQWWVEIVFFNQLAAKYKDAELWYESEETTEPYDLDKFKKFEEFEIMRTGQSWTRRLFSKVPKIIKEIERGSYYSQTKEKEIKG